MNCSGKRITIRDVAEKSGVSTATVSRVLNGEIRFPETTRKKVWKAAHTLGYEPSIQARQLRSGQRGNRVRTNLIMYLFNLAADNPIGDRFTADCAQMFDWMASRKGFYTTNYRYFRKEGFHCPLILDRLVDGVVIGCPHQEVIDCVSKKVPTVLINVGESFAFPEIPRVVAATETGMCNRMLEAYRLEHRKTALVGSIGAPVQDSFALNHSRLISRLAGEIGFELTVAHRYQPPDLNPSNHEQRMDEIANALIPEIRSGRISLILCEDSCYARSIYTRLTGAGIRLPEEVSMITIDSISPIPEKEELLTAVAYDWPRMYTAALDVLKELIDGKQSVCRDFLVPVRIREGKTLGRSPEKAGHGKTKKKINAPSNRKEQ